MTEIAAVAQWYWTEARRTASDAGLGECGLRAHSILGMASEIGELEIAEDRRNVYEEIGDLLWYVACGVTEREFRAFLAGAILSSETSADLGFMTGFIVDEVKSLIFYKKSKHPEVAGALRHCAICAIRRELLPSRFRTSVEERTIEEIDDLFKRRLIAAMKLNIKKLHKRYPSGTFSELDAVARADKGGEQ